MNTIEDRLSGLGIEIPQVNPPQGNYLSYVRTGSLVFVAGQGPGRTANCSIRAPLATICPSRTVKPQHVSAH